MLCCKSRFPEQKKGCANLSHALHELQIVCACRCPSGGCKLLLAPSKTCPGPMKLPLVRKLKVLSDSMHTAYTGPSWRPTASCATDVSLPEHVGAQRSAAYTHPPPPPPSKQGKEQSVIRTIHHLSSNLLTCAEKQTVSNIAAPRSGSCLGQTALKNAREQAAC